MTGVDGTGLLLRLIVRVDRVRLTVWTLALGLIPVVVASSFAALYDTDVSRQELVATVASSPGLVALLGPVSGTSVGALTVWRMGTIGAVFVALMSAFTVLRHTRLDEESGRRELLGSTVVGRHAPLLAATSAAALNGIVIALILALGLIGLGEAPAGTLAFGATWALTAVLFAAIGALVAQLTEATGTARGVVVGLIGVFYALRMAGDGGSSVLGWLTWLSPFGWVSKVSAYGGERWWVLSIFLGLALVFSWAAFALSSSRDVGASVFPPRPGRRSASRSLGSVNGLAWHLHRRGLLGWSAGIALFAVVWGGLADSIGDLLAENPQLKDIFESLGRSGGLTDIFFAAAMGIVALIVSAYAIGAVMTLRIEEDALRAEQLLATPTSRLTWSGSHIAYAVAGPVLLMSLAGLAAGLTYGVIAGEVGSWVSDLVKTALLQVPAIWVMVGLAVFLYGLVPRLTALSWGLLVAFLVLGQLGQILQLPQWAMDLSPFTHVPAASGPVPLMPLVVLAIVGTVLLIVGMVGFRRRDLL